MKSKKFNIIDIIIIVAIIAVAAVCVLMFGVGKGSGEPTKTKLVTLEITEKYTGFYENVVIGDKVTERVQKQQIGKVVGVDVKPCQKQSYNRITGEPTMTTIPERENVYVTMELDEDAAVGVGKMLSVITKHFAGHGYVVKVEDN